VTARLHRRIGFEVELMAPPGVSRRTLALDLAARCGGRVRPIWHHDSEPSLVPGLGRFLHLTQGFEVIRGDGEPLCRLVDDVTLVADLDPRAVPRPGWFRILSDDTRLLSLLARHSDPGGTIDAALDGTARLWGSTVQRHDDVYLLDDPGGTTIALAAPQGGERERPCEIVTPPLSADHHAALAGLLGPAGELGFTVPVEAAVHLHFDGAPFRSAHALANVVRLFGWWREPLRTLLGTNPACRRLAPLPPTLMAAVAGVPGYDELGAAATAGGLTKFFDVNLTQVLSATPVRDTVEIRILPGTIDPDEIVNRAGLVELLLARCEDPEPFPAPPTDPAAAFELLLRIAAGALAEQSAG
jgi:putative amidoligase enzyme